MRNKIILLFTSALSIFTSATTNVNAQTSLFTIPDTVCAYNLITPRLENFTGETFKWTFCPPQFHLPPGGVNIGNTYGSYTVAAMDVEKFGNEYFGFLVNTYGNMVKWWFKNGIDAAPINSDLGIDAEMPASPSGLQIVQDGANAYVFVIGGSNISNTKLVRLKFANGINNPASEIINLGNVGGLLQISKTLLILKEGNNWVGFTFNRDNVLTRLDFGNNIENNTPIITEMPSPANNFGIVTSLMGYNDNGNWHLFATDRIKGSLVRISLGNSLTNTPVETSFGDMSGRIELPVGYSVIPHCGEYYGYTISRLGSSITKNIFNPNLSNDTSEIENLGNAAGMVQPRTTTQFIYENGVHYMFVANTDSTVSRIEYTPCTSANIAGADTKIPPSFKYLQPGKYSVTLIVNVGQPNMRYECQEVEVLPAPEVLTSNDTMICEGSKIRIEALYQGAYGITWTPNYNITDTNTNIVDVWPTLSTDYIYNINFGNNCVYNDTVKVKVSRIRADAGADRTIPDGHTVMIGGPNTALGSEFTYRWYPTDFFTSANNKTVATAKPGHSITYYLEVTNTDGCVVTDSVNITMECGDITVPNVFIPYSKNGTTSTFGIQNLQLVKLNYFRVYDRWGMLVFETQNVADKWNGKFKNRDVPEGVYVYEIDGFCISGNRLRKAGNVTVLR